MPPWAIVVHRCQTVDGYGVYDAAARDLFLGFCPGSGEDLVVTDLFLIVLSNEISVVRFLSFLPRWHRVLRPNSRVGITAL